MAEEEEKKPTFMESVFSGLESLVETAGPLGVKIFELDQQKEIFEAQQAAKIAQANTMAISGNTQPDVTKRDSGNTGTAAQQGSRTTSTAKAAMFTNDPDFWKWTAGIVAVTGLAYLALRKKDT